MIDLDSFAARLTEIYQRLWLIAAAITGDRTEADDIVQEAAMVALRKLGEFVPGTNFAAWMGQIVRLTALNYVRKTTRHSIVSADPHTLDQSGTSATAAAGNDATVGVDGRLAQLQSDFDDDVLDALEGVGEVTRACLLLRIVQQLSYAEIAKTLQIPEGTAMSHVHRGRQALRVRLTRKQDQNTPSSGDMRVS